MCANTECYAKLFSISSCPLHTGFLCPSPKFMYIGTMIPTPSAHDVKQLWSENTKPSVIVAVNGLIGRNMKMQKWYIRSGVGQPQMKTTNKSVKLNSHNILKSRCTRSHTKFGTKLVYPDFCVIPTFQKRPAAPTVLDRKVGITTSIRNSGYLWLYQKIRYTKNAEKSFNHRAFPAKNLV